MRIPGYDFECLNLNQADFSLLEEPIGLSPDDTSIGYIIASVDAGDDGDNGSLIKVPLEEMVELGRFETPMGGLYIKADTTEGEVHYEIFDFIALVK